MSETESTGPTLRERMEAVARGERLPETPVPTIVPAPAAAVKAEMEPALAPEALSGEILPPIVEAAPISAALVETARAEGADVETGELPPREPEPRIVQPGIIGTRPAPDAAEVPPQVEPAPTPKAEVIEPERAADGQPVPFAARDAGAFVNLLENGQFSADVVAALTALTTGMSELAENTGKRQKGSITLKISLQTDDSGEAFFVTPEFKVVAPKVPRRQTLMWQDEKGHMSPSQPRQRVFFGQPQEVGGTRQIRDASEPRRQF